MRRAWLTSGVGAIDTASLLADLEHEIPTALLPSFLASKTCPDCHTEFLSSG